MIAMSEMAPFTELAVASLVEVSAPRGLIFQVDWVAGRDTPTAVVTLVTN
jgi:hypothetical protein